MRTESFAELGKMYGTKPGHYLLAPASWKGEKPDGLAGEFRFDTASAVCIPRVFMDDTAADREAIQPLIDQIMLYPLTEYTGRIRTTDWRNIRVFPASTEAGGGDTETQWVDPSRFFDDLSALLAEVPARPGEETLYAWFGSRTDPGAVKSLGDLLRDTAVAANGDLIGQRLNGDQSCTLTFPAESLPARPGILVPHPLQPAPLLRAERHRPILPGHKEQGPALQRRRIAHHPRPGPSAHRKRRKLAARSGRPALLPLPARLLARPGDPVRRLDPAARHPSRPVLTEQPTRRCTVWCPRSWFVRVRPTKWTPSSRPAGRRGH